MKIQVSHGLVSTIQLNGVCDRVQIISTLALNSQLVHAILPIFYYLYYRASIGVVYNNSGDGPFDVLTTIYTDIAQQPVTTELGV